MRSSGIKNPMSVGEVLGTLLDELQVSQRHLARALRVSQPYLSDIINGKRGISAEMACKLSKVLGSTPETWMSLQSRYELSKVKRSQISGLSKIAA